MTGAAERRDFRVYQSLRNHAPWFGITASHIKEIQMKALSSHVIATLAMLLSVSAAVADSHATFAGTGKAVGPRELVRSDHVMWSVLPSLTPFAETAPSVIVREAPTVKRLVREEPVQTAPVRSPVEEVEEHVRGGLALVSYLVSR